jgi:hypothetical protein
MPNPSSWRTTLCWLSTTAYSIYLQLPSISGGHLLHLQPEDAPCHGDKGPTKHGIHYTVHTILRRYILWNNRCLIIHLCKRLTFVIILLCMLQPELEVVMNRSKRWQQCEVYSSPYSSICLRWRKCLQIAAPIVHIADLSSLVPW